jgi:hypothetical protein
MEILPHAPPVNACSAPTPPRNRNQAALAVLLALLAAWGLGFIWRSSFVLEGRRIFCLFDDAMISMTYARNLLDGKGLEWARQGRPVEGFTHPLWLAAMLPANLPAIPLPLRCLPVQLLSLALLAALVAAVKRVMQDHFGPSGTSHWLPAAALTAFYYPLAYWSLLDMETAMQALLAVVSVGLALAITERGEDRHRALWGVCTAAYLLRMDLALLVAGVQLWVLAAGGLREPGRRRHWVQGLALFSATALGYEVFRGLYFHDLLPNTYYLKLTGVPLDVRLLRGLATFGAFALGVWPLLLAVAAGTVLVARRERRLLLPAAFVALYLAYDVWVGGDAWELSEQAVAVGANRFLAPMMPLVFVLFGALLNRALAACWAHTPVDSDPWPARLATVGLTAIAFAVANGLVLSPDALEHRQQLTLAAPPPNVDRQQEVVRSLLRFESLVAPGAVVATAWAGIPAFFSDYRMIDILGYNDRQVARLPSTVPLDRSHWRRYVPGHVKWDQRRLLEEQRPDAFFQTWGVQQIGRAHHVMPAQGYRFLRHFWVRADSPFVHPPVPDVARLAPSRRSAPRARRVRAGGGLGSVAPT